MMKQSEIYEASCASGRALCVNVCTWLHAYACSSWHRGSVSGLCAVCKSLRLGGRQNLCLIPRLFSQAFTYVLAHKKMFTVHAQRLGHEGTCAYWQWIGVFLCRQVSSEWSAGPQVQLVVRERVSEGDGGNLHNNSWKLDDCSMCSCLTGDP